MLANSATYESTGLNRGLKTQSQYWAQDPNNAAAWALQRTASYGYDAQRDFLTSVNHGDSNPFPIQNFTYDTAGNRLNNASVYDSLNRVTEDSSYTYTHDALGNRLVRTVKTSQNTTNYAWDELNRMVGYNSRAYTYRADGMRTRNAIGNKSTFYRYDGQMGFQDVERQGSTLGTLNYIINYGLGARGVDFIEKITSTSTVQAFPIYDTHGNNVASLTRNGTSYSLGDQRSYGAWGEIRSGATTGDPKGRYVANLGHKQDDESGLIYMRARYYEPTRGRFISEDSAKAGENWLLHCSNDPIQKVDFTGNDELTLAIAGLIQLLLLPSAQRRISEMQRMYSGNAPWALYTATEAMVSIIGKSQMLAYTVALNGLSAYNRLGTKLVISTYLERALIIALMLAYIDSGVDFFSDENLSLGF